MGDSLGSEYYRSPEVTRAWYAGKGTPKLMGCVTSEIGSFQYQLQMERGNGCK
jgi:hypothetical protein